MTEIQRHHAHTFTHALHSYSPVGEKNSLAGLARGLGRTLLFLKHPGVRGGVKQRSHKNLSHSLSFTPSSSLSSSPCGSHSVSPLPLVPLKHTQTHTHILTSAQRELLPDRLTGVSPPRHPPCRGRPDRPVPRTLPSSHLRPCPGFS